MCLQQFRKPEPKAPLPATPSSQIVVDNRPVVGRYSPESCRSLESQVRLPNRCALSQGGGTTRDSCRYAKAILTPYVGVTATGGK